MSIEFVVAFAVALFLLSVITDPLGRWLRIPHTVLLVAIGAVLTLGSAAVGWNGDLRDENFHDLVFFVFLPILVFESAYHLSVRDLAGNLAPILFLAVAGVLVTAFVSAALISLGLGGGGFPWIAALLTGAILAATDPVAVVAQLRELGAPRRLTVLLEGESLFNDASAIVLFGVVVELALAPGVEAQPGAALLRFLLVFFGGVAFGAAVGYAGAAALRVLGGGIAQTMLILSLAYGTYLLAEAALGLSGIMATLAAGLVLAHAVQREDSREVGTEISFTLQVLAYAANGSVFLLVGMTLSFAMFRDLWPAMLIAVGAVLVARVVTVVGGLALLNPLLREPVHGAYAGVMVWGGLRGAVTLALALTLPPALDYGWTVQAMAYGVVLFTLFVQAPTMPLLIRRTVLSR